MGKSKRRVCPVCYEYLRGRKGLLKHVKAKHGKDALTKFKEGVFADRVLKVALWAEVTDEQVRADLEEVKRLTSADTGLKIDSEVRFSDGSPTHMALNQLAGTILNDGDVLEGLKMVIFK